MVGLVVFSLVLVFSDTVTADHLFATDPFPPFPNRINMNANCGGVVNYDENTGFYVRHGWFYPFWNEAPTADKNAFMSPATTYELWVDGILQKSALHAFLFNFPGGQTMVKNFVIEDHDGMTGSGHTFIGRHFESAGFTGGNRLAKVLAFECTVTVNFV